MVKVNFVALGPGEILMTADNPVTQAFLEQLGITYRTCPAVAVDELGKGAGSHRLSDRDRSSGIKRMPAAIQSLSLQLDLS